ncbi:hypothetical protein [Motilimonas pumila]|nr:hypothetical protein [Motilimonas pumila]
MNCCRTIITFCGPFVGYLLLILALACSAVSASCFAESAHPKEATTTQSSTERLAGGKDLRTSAVMTPLDVCWQQAANRIALKPCLETLLKQQQLAYETAKLSAIKAMSELETISGDQHLSKQLQLTIEAGEQYARQLCRWQTATMRGATGQGDHLLSCQIIQLTQQTHHLTEML